MCGALFSVPRAVASVPEDRKLRESLLPLAVPMVTWPVKCFGDAMKRECHPSCLLPYAGRALVQVENLLIDNGLKRISRLSLKQASV